MKVIFIDQKDALDVVVAGGKGASLARLVQAGFNVPRAFVIPAVATPTDTQAAQAEIEQMFDELGSEHVSVRSSATVEDGEQASWAGQFETFLYVRKTDLIEKILACKASASSDRAQAYADQQGVTGTKVAVVVQKMVHSDVSGVGFSVNPISQNRDEMVVEAVRGLGEALVGGSVTPDTYIIAKGSLEIDGKHVALQQQEIRRSPNGGTETMPMMGEAASSQKLRDAQIKEVGEQLARIEKHYNQPIDIEWAYENDQLYILQARPITTLTQSPVKTNGKKAGTYGRGTWAG
jgi:pyruvate,water dikinase